MVGSRSRLQIKNYFICTQNSHFHGVSHIFILVHEREDHSIVDTSSLEQQIRGTACIVRKCWTRGQTLIDIHSMICMLGILCILLQLITNLTPWYFNYFENHSNCLTHSPGFISGRWVGRQTNRDTDKIVLILETVYWTIYCIIRQRYSVIIAVPMYFTSFL